jgi:glycosyltransferase involved in cell wall biosynthesis
MLGAVLFAALRRLLRREPLWLNIQDIPAEAAVASGISQSGLFNRLAPAAQSFLFNRADTWSTISPLMVDRLAPMRRRNQPLHFCPNWLHASISEILEKTPGKIGRLPATPIRLLYSGNIGKKQGLLEFCQLLAATKLNLQFQINGDGGEAGRIKDWVASTGDSRFQFGPFLAEADFVKALHDSDVFIITEKAGSGASFIPSKLIPAISTATPILAVCDRTGPLGREILEAKLGAILAWGDPLAPALSSLSENPENFVQLQKNCLAHSETYRREFALARMETLLKDFLASAGVNPAGFSP